MIAVAGINHYSAGLGQLTRASSAIKANEIYNHGMPGSIFIETCNRIKLYADLNQECQKAAAGLDSAIFGEDQVIHQLKKAYSTAIDKKLNSPLLNTLFHKAFETSKLVRTLTGINKGNVSVASIAAGLVQSFHAEYPDNSGLPILIIGAGETGALLTQIMVAIKKKSPILNYSVPLKSNTPKRIIIDLSVAFQVGEEVVNQHTFLYNLDHITEISQENNEKCRESVDDALQLVWASLHELKAWQEQEWVGQTLQQWQLLLHHIQERQLKLFEKENPGADLKLIADFGRALSANLLKQLAWTIRQQEKSGNEDQQWSKILSSVEPYEQLN